MLAFIRAAKSCTGFSSPQSPTSPMKHVSCNGDGTSGGHRQASVKTMSPNDAALQHKTVAVV